MLCLRCSTNFYAHPQSRQGRRADCTKEDLGQIDALLYSDDGQVALSQFFSVLLPKCLLLPRTSSASLVEQTAERESRSRYHHHAQASIFPKPDFDPRLATKRLLIRKAPRVRRQVSARGCGRSILSACRDRRARVRAKRSMSECFSWSRSRWQSARKRAAGSQVNTLKRTVSIKCAIERYRRRSITRYAVHVARDGRWRSGSQSGSGGSSDVGVCCSNSTSKGHVITDRSEWILGNS